MPITSNINGACRASTPYVNVNGVWRETDLDSNINGGWREVYRHEIREKDIVSFRVLYAKVAASTLPHSFYKNGVNGVEFSCSTYGSEENMAAYGLYVFAILNDGKTAAIERIDWGEGGSGWGGISYYRTARARNRSIRITGSKHVSRSGTVYAMIWNYFYANNNHLDMSYVDFDEYISGPNISSGSFGSYKIGGYKTSGSGTIYVGHTIGHIYVDGVSKPFTVEILPTTV